MNVLLQKVRIISPASPHHHSIKDIFISNGVITAIEDNCSLAADTTISQPGLCVSAGWMDVFATTGDPGYEYKETLATAAAAATAGGYTTVFVTPNTRPALDAKAPVEYVLQQNRQLPVQLIPLGAITKNADGKELAEMYDMYNSGALAFSDGNNPVQSAGLLLKALQYVKTVNAVVVQVPDDKSIAAHGLMHEGIVSTRLGLPGKPMMAEELIVARDIKLARYTNSKLHFTGVSSPKSLEYIKRAKEGGIQVTCSVTPYHLAFCDEDLAGYDTNLKLNPPLRTHDAMLQLRAAVLNGTIDCIATHHQPQDWDSKTCEFEYAKPGMTGLETCYSVLKTHLPTITDDRCVELLSTNARNIFNVPAASIEKGATANITLFQPEGEWTYTKENAQSKSHNSAFMNQPLKGRVWGIINGPHCVLNK